MVKKMQTSAAVVLGQVKLTSVSILCPSLETQVHFASQIQIANSQIGQPEAFRPILYMLFYVRARRRKRDEELLLQTLKMITLRSVN